jgi:hypothetical protein
MGIPGFVDIQINGWGGVDFSSETLTEEGIENAFDQIGELHQISRFWGDTDATRIERCAARSPLM